ncbi:MAG: hypothetical protein GF330_13470 [Candidatus Eisenbacteria bacterium]|nr:hypothetical protein [Candidatus Eisenbacteria bacterium]
MQRAAGTLPLLLGLLGSGLPASAQTTPGLTAALAQDRLPVAATFHAQWQWRPDGQSLLPVAVDGHSSGLICGLEAARSRLFLCDRNGDNLRLASRNAESGALGSATRIHARVGLSIFTLDAWNARIERYDLQGVREAVVDLQEAAREAGAELREAADFCIDRSGELFVLDGRRGRVLHFSRDGRWIAALTESGALSFSRPIALEVDGRGRLYVLEKEPPGLWVLDRDGRLLRGVGTGARGPEGPHAALPGLTNPAALVVDAWGNAFLADEDGTLLVLPAGGEQAWPIPRPPGAELHPSDLGLDAAGRLLVADPFAACVWVFGLEYAPSPAGASRGRGTAVRGEE